MASRDIKDSAEPLQKEWPFIRSRYAAINPGKHLVLTTTYRSPEEQFTLFKEGRTMDTQGHWVIADKSQVVTNIDGHTVMGAHNYYPSRAIDVVVVDETSGKIIWEEDSYHCLLEIAQDVGLESGGGWNSLKDWPHLQIRNYKDFK